MVRKYRYLACAVLLGLALLALGACAHSDKTAGHSTELPIVPASAGAGSQPGETAPSTSPVTRPTPVLTLGITGVPTPDLSTRLRQNPMPPRDLVALVSGLKNVDQLTPQIMRSTPESIELGQSKRFWISDLDISRFYPITASLRLQTEHVRMWVQEGASVEQEALERSARIFEKDIYPTNHAYFGQEWIPGIDGDPHLVVLNARFEGAAGYFASANEYPRLVNPYSNEHEMFVMNLNALTPGTGSYDAVLAHEFQHMIHWHLDSNEEAWLNEGASELAEELNGYGWPRDAVRQFAEESDLQLNTWPDGGDRVSAHYGASYLMMRYFLNRYGPEALRALVQAPDNGIASFDTVLVRQDTGTTFDDLFADWLVANALDAPEMGDGRYGYPEIDLTINKSLQVYSYPHTYEGTVHQYAADYIELFPSQVGPLHITFSGTPEVKLVPNESTSGRFQWWSNRGDSSHAYLERRFDLREATTATLSFNLWYHIEAGWDYAYVRASRIAASPDGEQRWQLLQGRHMIDFDPNGNALGAGYTGKSGVPIEDSTDAKPIWVRDILDLHAFCGQQILLRFDYVTDDAVNKPGLCLDDFALTTTDGALDHITWVDDVEVGEDEWRSHGFIRHDNRLPQGYIVQLIEYSETPDDAAADEGTANIHLPRVRRLPVGEGSRGEWVIGGFSDEISHALLVISATAPVTTERASYRLDLGYSKP